MSKTAKDIHPFFGGSHSSSKKNENAVLKRNADAYWFLMAQIKNFIYQGKYRSDKGAETPIEEAARGRRT